MARRRRSSMSSKAKEEMQNGFQFLASIAISLVMIGLVLYIWETSWCEGPGSSKCTQSDKDGLSYSAAIISAIGGGMMGIAVLLGLVKLAKM